MARERKYQIPEGDEIDYASDFEKWLEKGPTPKQKLFGEWAAEKTDAADRFKTQKELAAFKQGVEVALKYRMHFQRSPENHALTAEMGEERENEAAARAEAREAKKAARQAPAEDAAPAPKRGRRGAAAAEEAPAKPARRGRAAAKAEPVEDEAPATPRRGRPPRGAAAAKGEGNGTRRPAAATRPGRPARRGAANKAEAEF